MPLEHSILLGASSQPAGRNAKLWCIAEEDALVDHADREEGAPEERGHQLNKDGKVPLLAKGRVHTADETEYGAWSDRLFRERVYIRAVGDAAKEQAILQSRGSAQKGNRAFFPGDVSTETVISAVTACKER